VSPESPLPPPVRRAAVRQPVAPSLAERAAAVAGGGWHAGATAGPAEPRAAAQAAPSADSLPVLPRARSQPARGPEPAGPKILGIDPGTRVVGWGVIELTPRGPRFVAAGVVRAGSGELGGRLGLIRRELDRLIALHAPSVVAVEEAFAKKNLQSALRIGEARGVVLSCAAAAGVAVHQYTPATAKKALVGNGAAHKSQVAAMVARRLGLAEAPQPHDASDAVALALTHVLRSIPSHKAR